MRAYRIALTADDLLHGTKIGISSRSAIDTLLVCLACAFLYGGWMGSSGYHVFERPLQMFYSAVKLPALLVAAFAISLPSFFVLNTFAGVRDDFGRVLRALLTTQAALAVVLLSLAPITLLWYVSTANHELNIAFNGAMFFIATLGAQIVLRRHYRPLIAARPVHRRLLRVWLLIYAFVGIQAAWVLRPYIGDPGKSTQFFRDNAWGNAYVWLAQMLWRQLAA